MAVGIGKRVAFIAIALAGCITMDGPASPAVDRSAHSPATMEASVSAVARGGVKSPAAALSAGELKRETSLSLRRQERLVEALDPERNVFFDYGSAELPQDARQLIARVSGKLNTDRLAAVLLVGYSSDLGSPEFGVALSGARINAVADALVRQGVRPTQIRRQPRGNVAMTGPCGDEECRRAMRRVEFRLLD